MDGVQSGNARARLARIAVAVLAAALIAGAYLRPHVTSQQRAERVSLGEAMVLCVDDDGSVPGAAPTRVSTRRAGVISGQTPRVAAASLCQSTVPPSGAGALTRP